MESSVQKFDLAEGDASEASEPAAQRPLAYKIVKTACIILVWIGIGLWSEVNGSTLYDLMLNTNTTYGPISQAISMRGAGGLAGCLLGGGYIVDRFHSKVDLILAIALLGCAAVNAVVPYVPYIAVLYVLYVAEGWMEAFVNIGGQVIIMDTWGHQADGPLHIIHLGYSVGSFIAPQIVIKFVSQNIPTFNDVNSTKINPACLHLFHTNSSNISESTNTTSAPPKAPDSLPYGFLIISGLIVAISAVWFAYFFCDKKQAIVKKVAVPQDRKSIREIFNLNTCLAGHPIFVLLLHVFMFLWTYAAVAGERLFAKYLNLYSQTQLCFTVTEAGSILSAYWISFTVGRFAGFVVASFVPMKFVIFIEGVGNVVNALVLYFFSSDRNVLWVCVCVAGVLIGPCYPSGLAWANRYMLVTATSLTVLSIGAGVSDLSFLPAVGNTVDAVGLSVLTSFFLGYGVYVCILPMIMQGVACTQGDRFENAKNSDEND